MNSVLQNCKELATLPFLLVLARLLSAVNIIIHNS